MAGSSDRRHVRVPVHLSTTSPDEIVDINRKKRKIIQENSPKKKLRPSDDSLLMLFPDITLSSSLDQENISLIIGARRRISKSKKW